MEEKKDDLLFEMRDESSLIIRTVELLSVFGVIVFMVYLGASLQDKGLYSLRTVVVLTIVAIISFIIFLIFFYKKRKILFYKNNIVLTTGWIAKKDIKTIEIKEIYKILPYHTYSNVDSKFNEKIKRWDIVRKILFIIVLPILLSFSFLLLLT